MKSLVSVIVPAYNSAQLVSETLDSVLAQDYPAKQVIVVNDGSTDGTLAVLRSFADRITVVDQKNAGPPAARNAGLAAANGDYIAFVDADDIWLPGKLSAQVRHLDQHSDVGTVFTGWHVWGPEADGTFTMPAALAHLTVTDEIDASASGWIYPRLLLDCELLTSSVMLRGSTVKKIGGFDLELFNGDDYDYWLRASREGRITKLASTGVLYRVVPGSVSRAPRATNFELEVLQRALSRWGIVGPDGSSADRGTVERRVERARLAHAYAHLLHGDPRIALSTYRSAVSRHPLDVKLWLKTLQSAAKAARVG